MRRIVAAVVAAGIFGYLVGSATADSESSPATVYTSGAVGTDGPDLATAGEPPRAEAAGEAGSAMAAAVAAVGLTDEVAKAGFISRRDLIGSFTTDEFGPVLAEVTSDQLSGLAFELSERDATPSALMVLEQPVTARLVSSDEGRSVVDVWSVLAVAAPGVGPGRQVWRTVTVELVETASGWRVDGWSSEPGPTPALASESAVDSADALVEVLEWAPVWGSG